MFKFYGNLESIENVAARIREAFGFVNVEDVEPVFGEPACFPWDGKFIAEGASFKANGMSYFCYIPLFGENYIEVR